MTAETLGYIIIKLAEKLDNISPGVSSGVEACLEGA
jgi:hypothetical protein